MKLFTSPNRGNMRRLLDEAKENGVVLDTFLCTAVFGFFVHLFILATYIFNHDTLVLPYTNGDWLLTQGKWCVSWMTTYKGAFVLSYLGGAVGILAASGIAATLCLIFSVQNKSIGRLIGAITVAFPSVSTMLMYQAGDYFLLTALLATLAAFFFSRNDWLSAIIGVCLLTVSLGSYQAYVSSTAAILVILCITELLQRETPWKQVLVSGLVYIGEIIASIGFYYAILQYRLHITGTQLSTYKGIDNMAGILQPARLWAAIVGAVKNVYGFFLKDNLGLPSAGVRVIYTLVLLAILFLVIYIVYTRKLYTDVPRCALLVILLVVCLPLAANLIGVLSGNESYYYITSYSITLIFTALPLLVEKCLLRGDKKGLTTSLLKGISSCLIVLCICGWFIRSNQGYQKLFFVNYNIQTKATALVAQIQSVPGYTTETQVVLAGKTPYLFLKSQGIGQSFETVNTLPMGILGSAASEIYSDGVLYYFIVNHISPNMVIVGEDHLTDAGKTVIKQMEIYPNSGSLQMVDDTLIVKLGETE